MPAPVARVRALVLLAAAMLAAVARAARPTKYKVGDEVHLSLNTAGPYNNVNERYPFFSKLPFCQPKAAQSQAQLEEGSYFTGDRPVNSDYRLPFRENVMSPQVVCEKTLDQNQIKQYIDVIKENYMFEMFVDHELLITGFVGKEEQETEKFANDHVHEETEYYLFTHWNFMCEYNGPYVISCRITTDYTQRVLLEFGDDIEVSFTYTVTWLPTEVSVNDRLMYHVRKLIRSQPLDVHWLSILNSFVLVVLVTAFVAIVFQKILRADCARYEERALDDPEELDDPGWKQLHKDVFRAPTSPLLFAAAVGTGTQLFVLACCVLLLALIGLFYPGNRGALTTACILVYCFTAGFAGHVSGKLYAQLGGTKWATNAVLAATLFAVPFFGIFCIVNTIAWVKGSSTALPFSVILGIFVLWSVVTFPVTVFFAHRVRDTEAKLDVPGRVSQAPRELPKLPWYRGFWLQVVCAGVLPFTAIYIELHFLFTAVFGHQVYTLFGILTLAFLMLLIVASAVTIGLTYFQLQSENWQWWWRAFSTAGSTGVYIAGYAVFFYQYRSYMSGALQAAYFFGYVAAAAYAFFLLLGAVGWWATFYFLKQIYSVIKAE